MTQALEIIGNLKYPPFCRLVSLDPFNTHAPKIVDTILNEDGKLGAISHFCFSPSGAFLACVSTTKNTFQVSLWDLTTGSVAHVWQTISVDGKLVVSITWLKYIAVTMDIGEVYLYDPSSGREPNIINTCLNNVEDGIVASFFHPTLSDTFIICTKIGDIIFKGLFDDSLTIHTITECNFIVGAVLHDSGLILLATQNGCIRIFNNHNKQELEGPNEPIFGTNVQVSHIAIHPTLKYIYFGLVKDKSIRIMNFELTDNQFTLTLRFKLHDAVNKWNWCVGGFSHDGELVWASFHHSTNPLLIYCWDSNTGTLMRVLEGPKEPLMAAAWSPRLPCLITTLQYGKVLCWVPEYPVRWSALVPGLEEVTENVLYVEREDEFDVSAQEEFIRLRRNRNNLDDSLFVDVVERDKNFIPIEKIIFCFPNK